MRYDIQRNFSNLRQEMHQGISTLRVQITEVGTRLNSVEHTVEKHSKLRSSVRDRFIDYAFKASWLVLASVLIYVLLHMLCLFNVN